jgi:colanic acid/amylovoran biosynthesis glycosyltransferase
MAARMRIAFVTGSFPKLSETFVLDQITGLLDLGHDVRIFAFDAANEPLEHASVARYGLLERTTLLENRREGLVLGALASLPTLPTWLGAIRYREALATRFAMGSQGDFDVIYCHFGHVAERARRLRRAGFFTGPLVAVFHAYDLSVFLRERGRDAYRELFRDAARLLPITDYWRRELVRLGADPRKVEVRRMGVDLDPSAFRARTIEPGGPLELVSIGRLVEKKGFGVAIEALSRIRSELPRPVAYHVIGDGPMRSELEGLARKHGLDDTVVFHGEKARADVARLLDTMHVLLVPSVTAQNGDVEGLPMVLLEAMARGLPVVASDHTGIPEAIQHDATGWLVPERDPDALGKAILNVARHPERWHEVATAARRLVETRHDLKRLSHELGVLFEGLRRPVTASDRAVSAH